MAAATLRGSLNPCQTSRKIRKAETEPQAEAWGHLRQPQQYFQKCESPLFGCGQCIGDV